MNQVALADLSYSFSSALSLLLRSSPRYFVESFVELLSSVLRLHEGGHGSEERAKVYLARLV